MQDLERNQPPAIHGLAALAGQQAQQRNAELRQSREIAQALGLPAEEQYAIRSALYDEDVADLRAAIRDRAAFRPSEGDADPALLGNLLTQLSALFDSLLRARLQEHFAQLRQSLQSGGLGQAPTPDFGWRFAPAEEDEDIWATPTARTQDVNDPEKLLREVRALLDELSSDPSISRVELAQALLFIRAGLRGLRPQERGRG